MFKKGFLKVFCFLFQTAIWNVSLASTKLFHFASVISLLTIYGFHSSPLLTEGTVSSFSHHKRLENLLSKTYYFSVSPILISTPNFILCCIRPKDTICDWIKINSHNICPIPNQRINTVWLRSDVIHNNLVTTCHQQKKIPRFCQRNRN